MSDEDTSSGLRVRVHFLEEAVGEIKDAMQQVATAVRTIALLEERHAQTRDGLQRAFAAIDRIDGRLAAIEQCMPELRRMKTWVDRAVLGVVGAVGLAVLALLFR